MKRIMVIEDNEPDLLMLHHALGEAGLLFELDVIGDGAEARNRLEGSQAVEPPHLILLDMNVPKADGLALLRGIRQSPWLCDVPVVIWSSTRFSQDFEAAQSMRIADFVIKPSNLEGWSVLARQLRSMLNVD